MGRKLGKLSPGGVSSLLKASKRGYHSDGAGL